MPCRVRGCEETWLWPARQQILAGLDAKPPERMCERCEGIFRGLDNRKLPCKVGRGKEGGCTGTFVIGKWAQLEAQVAGRKQECLEFINQNCVFGAPNPGIF